MHLRGRDLPNHHPIHLRKPGSAQADLFHPERSGADHRFFRLRYVHLGLPEKPCDDLHVQQYPDSIGDLLQKGLSRIGTSSRIYGNIKDADHAAVRAEEFDCMVGLPAEMLYLARTAPNLRPDTVLLSADYVPEAIIQALEFNWQCRVFTHYGMTETGYGGGVQCGARKAYHLRDADLLVEIVDPDTGSPLPPSRTGEVVLSTLQNEAMPLIRYRTGDLAKMAVDPCPCGASLHRLDKVSGRLINSVRIDDQPA